MNIRFENESRKRDLDINTYKAILMSIKELTLRSGIKPFGNVKFLIGDPNLTKTTGIVITDYKRLDHKIKISMNTASMFNCAKLQFEFIVGQLIAEAVYHYITKKKPKMHNKIKRLLEIQSIFETYGTDDQLFIHSFVEWLFYKRVPCRKMNRLIQSLFKA